MTTKLAAGNSTKSWGGLLYDTSLRREYQEHLHNVATNACYAVNLARDSGKQVFELMVCIRSASPEAKSPDRRVPNKIVLRACLEESRDRDVGNGDTMEGK